jgi:hypothetical protein
MNTNQDTMTVVPLSGAATNIGQRIWVDLDVFSAWTNDPHPIVRLELKMKGLCH